VDRTLTRSDTVTRTVSPPQSVAAHSTNTTTQHTAHTAATHNRVPAGRARTPGPKATKQPRAHAIPPTNEAPHVVPPHQAIGRSRRRERESADIEEATQRVGATWTQGAGRPKALVKAARTGVRAALVLDVDEAAGHSTPTLALAAPPRRSQRVVVVTAAPSAAARCQRLASLVEQRSLRLRVVAWR